MAPLYVGQLKLAVDDLVGHIHITNDFPTNVDERDENESGLRGHGTGGSASRRNGIGARDDTTFGRRNPNPIVQARHDFGAPKRMERTGIGLATAQARPFADHEPLLRVVKLHEHVCRTRPIDLAAG